MNLHNKINALSSLNMENISVLSKKIEIFMEKVSSLYLTLFHCDYPINTFHATGLFLYPLKNIKTLLVVSYFQGV